MGAFSLLDQISSDAMLVLLTLPPIALQPQLLLCFDAFNVRRQEDSDVVNPATEIRRMVPVCGQKAHGTGKSRLERITSKLW